MTHQQPAAVHTLLNHDHRHEIEVNRLVPEALPLALPSKADHDALFPALNRAENVGQRQRGALGKNRRNVADREQQTLTPVKVHQARGVVTAPPRKKTDVDNFVRKQDGNMFSATPLLTTALWLFTQASGHWPYPSVQRCMSKTAGWSPGSGMNTPLFRITAKKNPDEFGLTVTSRVARTLGASPRGWERKESRATTPVFPRNNECKGGGGEVAFIRASRIARGGGDGYQPWSRLRTEPK